MNSFDSPAPSLNIQKIYFKFCHCSLPISCLTILTTWSFVVSRHQQAFGSGQIFSHANPIFIFLLLFLFLFLKLHKSY